MKKTLFALAIIATFALSACTSGPNFDDAKSYASWNCDKMKEMMSLIEDPVANAFKIDALGAQVEATQKKFEEHHGDKAAEMQKKVDEALLEVCPDFAASFK